MPSVGSDRSGRPHDLSWRRFEGPGNVGRPTFDVLSKPIPLEKIETPPIKIALVMVTALGNQQSIIGDSVNNPVLIINSSRPIAGKTVSERLRLSNALKRRSNNCFNKLVCPFEEIFICFLPIKIILPSLFGKYYFQPKSSRSVPLLLSRSKIDSSSLLAFLGLLNK